MYTITFQYKKETNCNYIKCVYLFTVIIHYSHLLNSKTLYSHHSTYHNEKFDFRSKFSNILQLVWPKFIAQSGLFHETSKETQIQKIHCSY